MSLTLAAIKLLRDKGLSLDDVIEVAEACQDGARSSGAERQARYRERKAQRDVTGDVTSDVTQPHSPEQKPPTPHKTQTPSPQEKEPKGSQKNTPQSDWPDDYREQVWAAYGKPVDKKPGLAKLDEIRKAGKVTFADLMAGIGRQSANVEPQFRPSLERWLKKEKWTDDYPSTGPPNGSGPPVTEEEKARFLADWKEKQRHAQQDTLAH